MRNHSIRLTLAAAGVAALAGSTQAQRTIQVADTGALVRLSSDEAGARSAVSRDGGASWTELSTVKHELNWRSRSFDPANGDPTIPQQLRANEANELFYVQFVSDIVPEYAQALENLGADSLRYYPNQAYIARLERDAVDRVGAQPFVRAITEVTPGHKIDPEIQDALLAGELGTERYNLMMVNKYQDSGIIEAQVEAHGGIVEFASDGGILIEATLTPQQLVAVAGENSVIWIDRWSAPEYDVDNMRIQAGINYVETMAGIDGKGMRGLLNEAVHENHEEFAARPPYRTGVLQYGGNSSSSHGTNTAGIPYAQGLSGGVKGIVPYSQMTEANSVGGGRYAMAVAMNDPNQAYKALVQTQSWGGGRVTTYTSTSALMDDILFDHPKFFSTQSQSNAGARPSRPEAWAKNVCGIGGFNHYNNADPTDDCWCFTGSIGPANDGRVGVSFAAYYDNIRTTNLSSGYSNGFGGTSGATPCVNGISQAAIQMFTDGLLGYPGVTWDQRFGARPNLTTTRVMLAVTTDQLNLQTQSRRVQQGWGLPNLTHLYDERDNILILDEEDVLAQGETADYWVWVKPGTGEFRASMHHIEDEVVPSTVPNRINSLDLSVTEYSSGTLYWGNDRLEGGIMVGKYSRAGGNPNDVDIHENVFLQNPASGVYRVSVNAQAVRQDGHTETPAMDVDFALAIRGIGGGRDRSGMTLDMTSTGFGDFDVTVSNLPGGWTNGITMFSADTSRHVSLGDTFGVMRDSLSKSIIGSTPSAGALFAFTNSGGGYPFTTFELPTGLAQSLSGQTYDAVVVLFDASGNIVDVSNADRVTVQ